MKKIYEKVMGWFRGIGIDKHWHFIVGMIIAAFFAMVIGLEVCILPVIAVAFLKEMYDTVVKLVPIDWWDLTATILGGLIIQIFVYL